MKAEKDVRTLRDLLSERGWIKEPEIIALFIGIAQELETAHSNGSLHGDVKPEKIARSRSGRYGPIDYGVSRLGTARYMSPERARRIQPDARSDIYSLGVVMYEAATGKPPFEGLNYELLRAHADDTPPLPRTLRPEISAGLQRVILTAMAKNPGDRYQTAHELIEALRGITAGGAASSTASARDAGLTPAKTPVGIMSGRRPPPGPGARTPGKPAASTRPVVAETPKPSGRPETKPAIPEASRRTETKGESRAISSAPAASSLSARPKADAATPRPATAPSIGRPKLLIGAGLGVLAAVVLLLVLLSGGKAKTPVFIGLEEDEAVELAGKSGLVLVFEESRDDTLPARRVAVQRPPPGTKTNREDTVRVALSTGLVEVPDVIGLGLDEASTQLGRLTLSVTEVDSGYSDEHSPGRIAGLSPRAGTKVDIGRTVRVTIAAGRATCPDCGATRIPGARFCTTCGHQFAF